MTQVQMKASELQPYVEYYAGGQFVTWAGSSTGAAARCARHPGHQAFEFAYHDVDFFARSEAALATFITSLIHKRCMFLDKEDERKWIRLNSRGRGDWHTTSIRMVTPEKVEFNAVFKTVGNHPLRLPHEILNSFDFSNVSMGQDMSTLEWTDIFYQVTAWRGSDPDKVRLLPERYDQWSQGNITKYPGVRQGHRYAVNVDRQWDLDIPKPVLVAGYRIVSAHYWNQATPEEVAYADTYKVIADLIEQDRIDDLLELYALVGPKKRIEDFTSSIPMVAP